MLKAHVIVMSHPTSLLADVLIDWLLGTQVLKCQEGLYNKAFILAMDDGSEILAKLPCPAAGPKYYTTASEVATRDFVRCNLR